MLSIYCFLEWKSGCHQRQYLKRTMCNNYRHFFGYLYALAVRNSNNFYVVPC
jgi:hypothetical protein